MLFEPFHMTVQSLQHTERRQFLSKTKCSIPGSVFSVILDVLDHKPVMVNIYNPIISYKILNKLVAIVGRYTF